MIAAAAATLAGAWLAARRFGHGRPCPVLLAPLFDNRIAERLSGTASLIDRAGIGEGMRVLDAGCGPGRLTIPLARRVGPRGEVVALDMQPGMLDRVMGREGPLGERPRVLGEKPPYCSFIGPPASYGSHWLSNAQDGRSRWRDRASPTDEPSATTDR